MLLQTGHRICFLACKERRGGVQEGAVQGQDAHLEEARVHQSWCSGLEQLSVEYNHGSVVVRSEDLPDMDQRCGFYSPCQGQKIMYLPVNGLVLKV